MRTKKRGRGRGRGRVRRWEREGACKEGSVRAHSKRGARGRGLGRRGQREGEAEENGNEDPRTTHKAPAYGRVLLGTEGRGREQKFLPYK